MFSAQLADGYVVGFWRSKTCGCSSDKTTFCMFATLSGKFGPDFIPVRRMSAQIDVFQDRPYPSSISFNKGPSEVRLTDPLTRERGCFSAKITFPEGECLLRFPANLDPSFICFNECPGLWTPLASHDTYRIQFSNAVGFLELVLLRLLASHEILNLDVGRGPVY